jgi:hypothetical protein
MSLHFRTSNLIATEAGAVVVPLQPDRRCATAQGLYHKPAIESESIFRNREFVGFSSLEIKAEISWPGVF